MHAGAGSHDCMRHLRIVLDGLCLRGEPLPGPVVDDAAPGETMGLPPD
ncbi:hypothetical protein [Pseudonocardia sp. MH-G8]|nr:hypothetical protein [Pseudonocardia sp. MH-G8]